jgi:hypothetical protein
MNHTNTHNKSNGNNCEKEIVFLQIALSNNKTSKKKRKELQQKKNAFNK